MSETDMSETDKLAVLMVAAYQQWWQRMQAFEEKIGVTFNEEIPEMEVPEVLTSWYGLPDSVGLWPGNLPSWEQEKYTDAELEELERKAFVNEWWTGLLYTGDPETAIRELKTWRENTMKESPELFEPGGYLYQHDQTHETGASE